MGEGVWSLSSRGRSSEWWEICQAIARRGEGWEAWVISVVSSPD